MSAVKTAPAPASDVVLIGVLPQHRIDESRKWLAKAVQQVGKVEGAQ